MLKFIMNHICRANPYRAVNTLPLGYKNTNQLMLYRKTVAAFFRDSQETRKTLCRQKVEFLSVKAGGIHNYHWGLKR
jgi:hypothetical protein